MSETYTYRNNSPDTPTAGLPLAGTRLVVQPNISIRGWLCNAGSRALDGFVALQDATVITRLKSAGVSLIGSSQMNELGFGLAGETAIQALCRGEADIALVTDTMGEARCAAAGAGLFGFKPSFGIVSRFGLIGLVPSMECSGLVARNPGGIIDTVAAVAGKDAHDPSMPDEAPPDFAVARQAIKGSYSAGVVKECLDLLNETEVRAFRAGLARLKAAGAEIREVNLPDYNLFRAVHQVVASVEASSSAGKYDSVRYGHRSPSGKNWNEMYLSSRGESFNSLIKTFLFQGAYFQFEDYTAFENACRIRNRLVQTCSGILGKVDFLVFPTRRIDHDPACAATIDDIYDAFLLTLPANVAGYPSVHVPSCAIDSKVDIGLQIMGKRRDDARLLSVAVGLASNKVTGGGAE